MATLVATVTPPKSTWPRQKMGKEGVGTHDNRGVKEEARRWRMLMMTMIVVVGNDDGMETNDNPPKNMRVALTSTVVVSSHHACEQWLYVLCPICIYSSLEITKWCKNTS